MSDNKIHPKDMHRPHIRCKYCDKFAPYSPIERLEHLGICVYFCSTCQAEYVHQYNLLPWSESIYVNLGSKMFRWTLINKVAQIWYVKTPGIPGVKENENMVLIKQFEKDIPEITPTNISKKLSAWLPFI